MFYHSPKNQVHTYVLRTQGKSTTNCRSGKIHCKFHVKKFTVKYFHSSWVTKANKLLGTIRRSFEFINADTMLCLYKSLIRPIIEYGNVIWDPHYVTDQQAIEKIQHRATKLIPELRHDSYQERLSKLSLPSFVYRRQRGDLIFLYQLINQHFNIDINDFFRYQTYTTIRGHNYKLYKPHAKHVCHVNFFTLRTINNWNRLPVSVVESATVNSFKNSLDSFGLINII